jgi:hypothetical protein
MSRLVTEWDNLTTHGDLEEEVDKKKKQAKHYVLTYFFLRKHSNPRTREPFKAKDLCFLKALEVDEVN